MARVHAYFFSGGTPERAAVVRFAFFLVVALDQWAQLGHLARYGAGNFNVSHFSFLEGLAPVPDRDWMVLLVLVQVVLAVRCAIGIALRQTVPTLALLYGTTYFWSQLDSYQHHYLVFLLLFVFGAALLLEPGAKELPHWSLRLARWVLAIMYVYAAIAKMDPAWLDGTTLRSALTSEWGQETAAWMASGVGVEVLDVLAWGAIAALVGELVLGVGLLIPRTRTPLWVLGVLFHISIEVLEFRIGLFSYFMAALYLLYAPRGLVVWLAVRAKALTGEPGPLSWGATVGGACVTGAALLFLPFESAALAAAVAVPLLAWPRIPLKLGMAQGLAAVLILGLYAGTDTVRDYYKYWGGDARRRGPVEDAITAYEHVVELDPEYVTGHVRLGDLYVRVGRVDEGRDAYENALSIEPGNSTAKERLSSLRGLP